jgi:predicted metalloendopeptidase
MSPQTINAQYDPQNNDLTFPAAILLSPFFNASGDDVPNYGAIGAVIGHEMTHGFDSQGRQFDAAGNLKDWWAPADAKSFNERAACIIGQYDALPVAKGVNQNGKLVQGEAIADFGGATLAYRAFQKTAEYKANRKIDGYTPDQRFFLAFAKVWAYNAAEQSLIAQAKGNEHPIGKNRVIGTLMNMPEFAKAFRCAANTKMVAKPRCRIW